MSESDLPDFGDWDLEGLKEAFRDGRAKAILDELLALLNDELRDRATLERLYNDALSKQSNPDPDMKRAFAASVASSRFIALKVLRTVARYLAEHERLSADH